MNDNLRKIIIAPLNWGLGHATRCVPIINSLLENNYIPVIASDGDPLLFLKKEFPTLKTIALPSYNINYGKNLKLSLLFQLPKILKAVKDERKIINTFIEENKDVVGLISDNRFGIWSDKIPTVYLTHQVHVLSGFTTFFTSRIHQKIISKYTECWIPDNLNSEFSGKLSSTKNNINKKFIGVLSRFKKQELENNIDILVVLSGLEPNRTILSKRLKKAFSNSDRKVIIIEGCIENQQKKVSNKNCTTYNYLLSKELEFFLNKAKIVICRSGYSSIMDLAVLEKKAFFIPTKNQSEQEYLANFLQQKKSAPFCVEDKFLIENLSEIKNYTGLKSAETKLDAALFGLFEGK